MKKKTKKKLKEGFTYTTQHHFELFKKWCKHFMDKYSLSGYSASFYWGEIGEPRANCNSGQTSMMATFSLNKIYDAKVESYTPSRIKNIAEHEVLHLLLARLTHFIPRYSSIDGKFNQRLFDQMMAAEHEVINKLMSK